MRTTDPDLHKRALALARRLPEEDSNVIAELLEQLRAFEGFALLVTSAMGNASRDLPPTAIVDAGRSVPESLGALSTFGRPPPTAVGHPHSPRRR
jgi:hypothetical protein